MRQKCAKRFLRMAAHITGVGAASQGKCCARMELDLFDIAAKIRRTARVYGD
jgi:hypothetical protein